MNKEVLTCGLSCLNAFSALFAKLVAVVIVSGEREREVWRRGRKLGPTQGRGYLKVPAQPPPSFTSETSMFTRLVRITLAKSIRHLQCGPATTLRIPLRVHDGQLQQRYYVTPPPQVNHR